ncbi:MAG: hypothetical protein JXB46_11360 [Candidatus Eisenbacteria bacterium]|nr:hypothetical protein [Candidatus Eisenbacteria bacterium]
MSTQRRMTSGGCKAWQGSPSAHLVAVVLGVPPLYSILVVLQLRGGLAVSLKGFTFYLAVISPVSILIALLLLRFLCGESPRVLNLQAGKVSRDLLAALVLSVIIIVASVISTFFLSRLFANSASNASVSKLFAELAGNPRLLLLFAGPRSSDGPRALLDKLDPGGCVRRNHAVELRS